jgi:hypothetical protein
MPRPFCVSKDRGNHVHDTIPPPIRRRFGVTLTQTFPYKQCPDAIKAALQRGTLARTTPKA